MSQSDSLKLWRSVLLQVQPSNPNLFGHTHVQGFNLTGYLPQANFPTAFRRFSVSSPLPACLSTGSVHILPASIRVGVQVYVKMHHEINREQLTLFCAARRSHSKKVHGHQRASWQKHETKFGAQIIWPNAMPRLAVFV